MKIKSKLEVLDGPFLISVLKEWFKVINSLKDPDLPLEKINKYFSILEQLANGNKVPYPTSDYLEYGFFGQFYTATYDDREPSSSSLIELFKDKEPFEKTEDWDSLIGKPKVFRLKCDFFSGKDIESGLIMLHDKKTLSITFDFDQATKEYRMREMLS